MLVSRHLRNEPMITGFVFEVLKSLHFDFQQQHQQDFQSVCHFFPLFQVRTGYNVFWCTQFQTKSGSIAGISASTQRYRNDCKNGETRVKIINISTFLMSLFALAVITPKTLQINSQCQCQSKPKRQEASNSVVFQFSVKLAGMGVSHMSRKSIDTYTHAGCRK